MAATGKIMKDLYKVTWMNFDVGEMRQKEGQYFIEMPKYCSKGLQGE